MERPAGQELSGWACTLPGSVEAGGTGTEPPATSPPALFLLGQGDLGVPEPDSETPVVVEGGFASRIPFPPSAAADLESGPDSAPDLITDEEDEQDSRLPGAAVGQLPGRRGVEGVSGDGAVSSPAPRLELLLLFAGAAEEEAAWEGGTPPGTQHSPGTLGAAGPHVPELSPTAAPATGAGGAESSQLPGEVRAAGEEC